MVDLTVCFSRKQHCELCHHPFSFTKVYRSDAPDALPTLLIVRRALVSLAWFVLFVLRALLVAFTWIGVLPYATLWVWRVYWYCGDHFARALSDLLLTRWTVHSANSTSSTVSLMEESNASLDSASLARVNSTAPDWTNLKDTLRLVLFRSLTFLG
jgi:E3 ubiquitin-protein ligase MARCH6